MATVLVPMLSFYQVLATAGTFFLASAFGTVIAHSSPGWVNRSLVGVGLILVVGLGGTVWVTVRMERALFQSSKYAVPLWWTRTRSRLMTVAVTVGVWLWFAKT